jgi:hypothetical protein
MQGSGTEKPSSFAIGFHFLLLVLCLNACAFRSAAPVSPGPAESGALGYQVPIVYGIPAPFTPAPGRK